MIIHGDCLSQMKRLIGEGVTVDAVVTDPPYHLKSMTERYGKEGSAPAKYQKDGAFVRASKGFMGKEWDGGDIAFRKETWALCFELLKAGGHLLAFSGSRTYHRMAVAIEDAGFDIRDQIMWIYGSGFPKSLNVGKYVDKIEGNEREFVKHETRDMRPSNSFGGGAQSVIRTRTVTKGQSDWEGWGTALKPAHEPIVLARKPISEKSIADNVVKHGTGALNIDECRVDPTDDVSGWSKSGSKESDNNSMSGKNYAREPKEDNPLGRYPANVIHDGLQEEWARYFYCPKTSTEERNTGLIGREAGQYSCDGRNKQIENPYQRNQSVARNTHPTVKPVELMRYLCRLVTPKGGTVLDPFMGSGSTGLAAKTECMEFIGIEREQEYFDIATDRINKTWVQPNMF